MLGTLTLFLALVSSHGVEHQDAFSRCSLPSNTVIANRLDGLPEDIASQLGSALPGLGDSDTKVQVGDVVREEGLPPSRFVGAVQKRRSWVIIYQRGHEDFVHSLVFAEKNNGRRGSYLLFPNSNLVGTICPVLAASLAGVYAGQDRVR